MADLLALPGVVEEHVLGGPVAVLAVHGGLEGGTAELAHAVAARTGASLYVCRQTSTRVHLASHLFDPAGSAPLGAVLARAHRVLSLHGYGRWTKPDDVLLGGAARDLANEVARAFARHAPAFSTLVSLDDIEEGLRGLHPANPVNATPGGGVQVELPHRARGSSPRSPAGAAATPHPTVVEALSSVVAAWLAGDALEAPAPAPQPSKVISPRR